ncbi:hypothetical protein ES703_04022 [subsurface metagenome]
MSFVVPSLRTRGFLCLLAKRILGAAEKAAGQCLVRILGALGKMAGKGLRKILK